MAGPGIRYWNMAKILSNSNEIILYIPNDKPQELGSDIDIRRFNKQNVVSESVDASCIVVQGMTLWNHSFIKKLGLPIVIDLYDPFIFENLEIFLDDKRSYRASLSVLMDQLSVGDYFICASEKQKDFWLGMLASINRINPIEYEIDKSINHLIGVVPFGLQSNSPIKTRDVLKGVVPGINKDDSVILWGGGIWDWLDPLTAIEGMKEIKKVREDVKLFFMGVNPPNSELPTMSKAKKAIQLSDQLGLMNENVFFNTWVKYEERQNYLLEADIGINLHHEYIETRFAYRTRILDYIWCELPIITTQGDSLSESVSRYKLGATINFQDPYEFAKTVLTMLELDKGSFSGFKTIKNNMTWEKCLEPLVAFCQNPKSSNGKKDSLLVRGLIRNKTQYYFVKTLAYIRAGRYSDIIAKIKKR